VMFNECGVAVFSHVGNSRENQEDNVLFGNWRYLTDRDREELARTRGAYRACYRQPTDRNFLLAVSDGMGGHACGEVASGMTVRWLSERGRQIMESTRVDTRLLANEIRGLNRSICAYSRQNPRARGMGATLCGVVCSGGEYYGFHVGDSRIYRCTGGRLERLSVDHTEGQRLLDLQLLSEAELKTFPRRKNLYRYLGAEADPVPDVYQIGFCAPGTTLLLCSDGLTDVISDRELESVLGGKGGIAKKGEVLLELALERNPGHGDNITLILIEF